MEIRVKKLNKDAKLPSQTHNTDACYDLFVVEEVVVTGIRKQVKHGIAIEIPYGYEGVVRSRSSSFSKKGLNVFIGTIDSGYRGELMTYVSLIRPFNMLGHANSYTIKKGEAISQLAIRKVPPIHFREVDELSESERGEGGFGSTDATIADWIRSKPAEYIDENQPHDFPPYTIGTTDPKRQCLKCYTMEGVSDHCYAPHWSG